jgi:hypothetical protein
LAWRLLHDASITVGKEQAVLLPEVKKVSTGSQLFIGLINTGVALFESLLDQH